MTELLPGGPPAAGGLRTSLDRVLDALQANGSHVRSAPGGYWALCPVHDDSNPSLHVTWRVGQRGGMTMVYCHACQARADEVTGALGLTIGDLFDEPLPERDRAYGRIGKSPSRRRAGQRRGKLGGLPARLPAQQTAEPEPEHTWIEVERYPYVDDDGQLVEESVRQACTSCQVGHKTFFQAYVSADGRRLRSKPAGFRPVLYRAPAVAAAVQAGEPIWLVEGEKDVHTAEGLGVVATTNAGGGRGFPAELIEGLRGAAVNLVLDRDDTGWARGVDLHAQLTEAGCTVRILLPAVLTAKADLSDHAAAGLTLDQLVPVLVEEVATWHALAAIKPLAGRVHTAVAQARGRWALAEAGEKVEDNRRFAQRWALESQICHESLRDSVDQVYGRAVRVGTSWAAEAIGIADQLLTHAADEARQCHHELGLAVPESLRQGPSTGRTLQTGDDTDPDPEDAQRGADSRAKPPSAFRILDGQIVQWEPDRGTRRRGEEEDEGGGKFKVLLSTVVRVTAREFLEGPEDTAVDEPELLGRASSAGTKKVLTLRRLMAVRLEFADPTTGEAMEIRVMADQWDDHSWLKALPGSPDYDHKRAGLDQLQRAVLAVSEDAVDEVLYVGTGWRQDPDGAFRYIHARGAITASGHQDAPVAFDRVMARYDLPDPTLDHELLRRAWLGASVTMLDRLPDRVAAPVLGHVFRAVLGHNPWALVLVGSPGSYKTSVASKVMHHFGERWDHNRPATSASGNGDTLNALRIKMHNAKDAELWIDDFAPTKGWADAQKSLEETIRLTHNQESRGRASRDGQSLHDGTPPRASGLFTSEVMPRPGSAAERALVVPLGKDDVDPAQLFVLDDPVSRHHRALVGSAFISWLAAGLTESRAWYSSQADQYAQTLIDEAGESVRAAQALASAWVGWLAITDCLTDRGAITAEERAATLERVDSALRAAGKAATNPDIPRTTAARVRELLSFALRQGLAYVDDVRDGECPPWPLAGRLGWRRTATELDSMGHPTRHRLERCGMRLGYVLHDPSSRERGRLLMCDSTQLEAVLKAASSHQAEKLEIDRATACRALHDEGVLIPDDSEGRIRHTIKCRIYAEDRVARMVALHLDPIIGGDDDGGEPTPAGGHAEAGDPPSGGSGAGPSDRPTVSEPRGSVVPDQLPPDSSQPSEEPMTSPTRSTAFTVLDRAGVPAVANQADPGTGGPCLLCGEPGNVYLSIGWMHPGCYASTTAEQRAAALGAATTAAGAPPARPAQAAAKPAAAPVQASRPAPVSAAPGTGFRAGAAVVDLERIWLSNGECVPMPGEGPKHVGDLVRLAEWLRLGTQVTKYRPEPGQVWVTAELAKRMGIDADALLAAPDRDRDEVCRATTKGSPAVTGALDAGYNVGGRDGDSLGRWSRVWKGTDRSVWVVLLPAMTRETSDVALMGDIDPARLARRLGLLATALGHPYKLSASTTGLDLMTALRWKDREAYFAVHDPIPPAQLNTLEPDVAWSRPPTEEERTHTWVHAFDRSGSYLAGVAGLEFGVGQAVHHPQGTEFVPRMPGYWRLEIPDSGDWRMPHPLDPRGRDVGRTRWVTTPGLEFAIEQGYDPQILEAYTWERRARIFDPWYDRIRDARTQLDADDEDSQVARDQLKQIYASTIGMLGSERFMKGRPGYAPERRHLIVAKARTNILRRVAKIGVETGRWPVAIVTDTVVYTSNEADPQKAWPGGDQWFGRNLGQYKPEGSALLADHLPYLTGGAYRGRAALVGEDLDGE